MIVSASRRTDADIPYSCNQWLINYLVPSPLFSIYAYQLWPKYRTPRPQ